MERLIHHQPCSPPLPRSSAMGHRAAAIHTLTFTSRLFSLTVQMKGSHVNVKVSPASCHSASPLRPKSYVTSHYKDFSAARVGVNRNQLFRIPRRASHMASLQLALTFSFNDVTLPAFWMLFQSSFAEFASTCRGQHENCTYIVTNPNYPIRV